METAYLLRSPANATRLLQSIEQANHGALTKHDLIGAKAAAAPRAAKPRFRPRRRAKPR